MNFTTGQILKDPSTKTTMYRVLETNEDSRQMRLVRSGKDGTIHGLVKKTQGEWVPVAEYADFNVIGTFTGIDKKKTKATKTNIHNSIHNGKAQKPQTLKPAPAKTRQSIASNNGDLMAFLETFHRSLADGMRELSRR
jgi:hypothetical protein